MLPFFEPEKRKILWIFSIALAALVGGFSGTVTSLVVLRFPGIVEGSGRSALVTEDPEKSETEDSATIRAVEKISPAVVSILIKKPVPEEPLSSEGLFDSFFFWDGEGSVQKENEAMVPEEAWVEVGGGTGFFVAQDGLLVTNKHVVSDGEAIYSIVTNDGRTFPVEVVSQDPLLDIAVLRVPVSSVPTEGFPTVRFGDADRLQIGQTVIAIGNTLSEYRNTVTRGIISGINRRVSAFGWEEEYELIEGAIQTDAAINPGNSGGPLATISGEVIGMNTAINPDGEGIGFAIPINEVEQAVASVRETGRIVRPWLGVRFVMLTPEEAEAKGVSSAGALLVEGSEGEPAVVSESPAEKAGLREGDVILRVNGKELGIDATLSRVIRSSRPGERVVLDVRRGEDLFILQAVLEEFTSEEE
ncbi:MAG TPA: trypsin-like peptidase domain-containing protein [Patescibacteria group bacterium]|nr:trypsin-like peptidase domain-containing protein [Patescibacteria group bacterium]